MALKVRIHNLWSKSQSTAKKSIAKKGKEKKGRERKSKEKTSPLIRSAKNSIDTTSSLFSSLRLTSAARPKRRSLLGPQAPRDVGRLCVVLDMDETLLHSRFTSVDNEFRQSEFRENVGIDDYDFSLTFNSGEGMERVYVSKRPGLHDFLAKLSKDFEPVVFTAALPVYAKPVLDRIDRGNDIRKRLYRDSTVDYKSHSFVKDLSLMGRDMRRVVLLDNNPMAMLASPDNAIPIPSWFSNPSDRELAKVLALLYELKNLKDVRPYLREKFRFRENLKNIVDFDL